jgi:predicted P-loop ATPase
MNDTKKDKLAKKIAAIRALRAGGYTLIPVNGKIPAIDGWQDTKPGEYDETSLPNNYGVALRPGDLIIDIDPRNFGWVLNGVLVEAGTPGAVRDKPLARLVEKIGTPLDSFTVRTGGNGLHVYMRKPADILVRNSLKEFPGIEFKAAGRQVVGPGSIHPETKQEYAIVKGSPSAIAECPEALLQLIARTAVPFDELGTGKYINDAATQGRYLDYLQHAAVPSVEGRGGDANAFKVACAGRDLALPPAVTWELMLEVWNPKCAPPWEPEELKAKVINAYKYAQGAVGTAHPSKDFEKIEPAPAAPKEEDIAWDTTPQGAVRKTFNNLLNYFRTSNSGLRGVFGYNEFTAQVEFTNPAPWHRGVLPRFPGVGDNDLKMLKGHLVKRCGFEMQVGVIEEAVLITAKANAFHPVREYLNSLAWDGKPRLDMWLCDYLGVEDSPYTRAAARKVLCAAVMRVMKPGVKFDNVLVLEGDQGVGKSTVIKILGGKWAGDFEVDPHNKDTVQLMQGKWLIEMPDLARIKDADLDAVKAFLSRDTDKVRFAYGRLATDLPRQSIFIASYNPGADETYLKDDTGNRRWWPVRCRPEGGLVDFAQFKEARNQLWAEAMNIVKTRGERLYMDTTELKQEAAAIVELRHGEHPWTERVALWLAAANAKPETRRDFLTGREVFCDALGGVDKQFDRRTQKAIAQVMRGLEWQPALKRVNTIVVRGYQPRPEGTAAPVTEKIQKEKTLDILADIL